MRQPLTGLGIASLFSSLLFGLLLTSGEAIFAATEKKVEGNLGISGGAGGGSNSKASGNANAGVNANASASASANTPKEDYSGLELILKTSKDELEKMGGNLSLDQKLALKKIAFNNDSELQVRWRALVLAAKLLGSEAETEIIAAAKSQDWFMRSASMVAANEISPTKAAELARKLVKDKALVVRSAAVDVLGGTGEASDRVLLWKIIKDPINVRRGQSLWVRSQALQILAKSPQKTEVGEFVALLKESDLELQAISIHALEKASQFQFGSESDSIEDHKNRWLNWWELNHKSKSI